MKNKIGTILLICSMWGSVVWGQSCRFPFQNPQLNEEARLDNLISLLTLDEKIALFGGAGIPRLGIRGAGSSEALHGIVQGGPAWNPNQPKQITTSFPQAYGLGATWDVELIQQVADYIAYEGRYLYQSPKYQRAGLILWSPNADLGRDIRWGRTEECYGEDPVLTAALTVAFVKGLQGSHPKYWKSASLMKHFLANSHECGRVETSSDFDETLFREYYSYPFWKGIELGGANALMTAYNAYNGIPCTISPVLRKVLQKEWGFDGMIITDGGAFQQLKNTHKVFERLEDAAAWADVVIVCLGNDPTGSQEWAKAPWGQTALAYDGREDVDRTSL